MKNINARIHVWSFKTAQDRDTQNLGQGEFIGVAYCFDDLVVLQHSHGGYLGYARDVEGGREYLSYAEVCALFKVPLWVARVRKARIVGVFHYLYYTYIFPLSLVEMSLARFRSWRGFTNVAYVQELDTFIYMSGTGKSLVVALARMTTDTARESSVDIKVLRVLYCGRRRRVSNTQSLIVPREELYIHKNQ